MQRLLIIAFCLTLSGEDLLTNQSGTATGAGDWVDLTSTLTGLAGTKLPYYVTGWDKYFYVPAIDAYCGVGSYYELSSEPNRNWSCYSFKENRWWMEDMSGPFHNAHLAEGGHPVGNTNVDPITSVALGMQGASGSQVQEEVKWGMWRYDFVGQVGIPQQPLQSIPVGSQLGAMAYDAFDQIIVGMGGDSASQGHDQYDNNILHTTCANNGYNCYNSWALEMPVTLNGLPISLETNSIASDLDNKLTYLFDGFASSSTHNWVWTYTPGTANAPGVWTNVFADVNSSASVTSTLAANFTIATGSNDTLLISIDGGANQTVTLPAGSLTCGQVATDINAVLTGGFAWCPVNSPQILSNSNLGASSSITLATVANSAYSTLGYTVGTTTGTTSTSCTDVNGLHNCPYEREEAGWAFDAVDNIFLMHGGCRVNNISGCTALADTWVYDPTANTWTQLNPPHQPIYTSGVVANERLVWMPEDNVFVLFVGQGAAGGSCPGESNSCPRMWAFRYTPGSKAGYASKSYSYTSVAGVGPLNRNTTDAGDQGWAYGTAIAANSASAYLIETETATAQIGASPSNSWLLHPYAQKISTGSSCGTLDTNFACLGTAYSSMSPDIGGNPQQAFDISCTIVGSAPWCSWHEENAALTETIYAKGWDGAGWNLGGVVPHVAVSGSRDGQTQIINVGGVPTVIMREQDHSQFQAPYPTYCYVQQWNGAAWTLLGGAINSGFTVCDGASIATDGTNIWVSFTLYGPALAGASNYNGVWVGPPQVQLYKWSGSAWLQQGASGNVLGSSCTGLLTGTAPPAPVGSSCSRAYNTSLTVLGGIPYVAFVERADQLRVQKLWVRKYNSGWSTVGGNAWLNKDQLNGWAFAPQIGNDGTNLYATWDEQGNDQPWVGTLSLASAYNQKPQVYAAKLTAGGALTYLGGALNADTVNGAATNPVLAIYNSQPIVGWGEVNTGSARQVYAKQWNGTDWGILAGGGVSPGGAFLGGGGMFSSGTIVQLQ